jgi:nitrogenase molybdenum-iron protein alpha/beta subunit
MIQATITDTTNGVTRIISQQEGVGVFCVMRESKDTSDCVSVLHGSFSCATYGSILRALHDSVGKDRFIAALSLMEHSTTDDSSDEGGTLS